MLTQEDMEAVVAKVMNSLSEPIALAVKNAMEAKAEEDKKNAADEDHREMIREIAALPAKAEGDFSGGLEEKVRTIIGLAEKLGYSKDDAGKNAKENECSEPKKENEAEEKKEEEVKENASEEKAEEKDSEKSEEAKDNSADEDKKEDACVKNEGGEEEKKEEKKENSKGFFSMLKNAKAKSQDGSAVDTMARGLALGKQRYGSTK